MNRKLFLEFQVARKKWKDLQAEALDNAIAVVSLVLFKNVWDNVLLERPGQLSGTNHDMREFIL